MQLTERERTQVLAAINEEYQTRLQASASYRNAMKGFVDANNRQAYMERAASEGKKLIPSIVQRHVNAVLDGRPKNQPVQKSNGTQKSVPVERRDATGVTWLAASPNSMGMQIDLGRTTHRMLIDNTAYIKGKPGVYKWKNRS
jgi:hypothetical protein